MKSQLFQDWCNAHPFIEDHLFYPEGDDCRWGRMRTNWQEKRTDGTTLSHLCAFTLDLQTGDLYLDCRKRKIWAKCVVLSFAHPLFGLIKTAYHLCLPLSIPVEIFKAISTGREQKQSPFAITISAGRNVIYSLADIVRTPVYTTAMTIAVLAAVLIGPLAPSKLYDLRALAGRLEDALNRGADDAWTLAPCFQPFNNVMDVHHHNYAKADTIYENDPTLIGLNNVTRRYVNFRRHQRNPFNDCFRLHPQDVAYVSVAYAAPVSA